MLLCKKSIELTMARKGLSYQDISLRYGCTRQRVGSIVNSRNVLPKTAKKLADALDVDVLDIIETEESS